MQLEDAMKDPLLMNTHTCTKSERKYIVIKRRYQTVKRI